MSNTAKILGGIGLGLAIAVALPALGHGYGNGYGYGMGMHGGGFGQGHHMMGNEGMLHGPMHLGANAEQRLGDLKLSLQLTGEQEPAWNRFETAVKNLSASAPWNTPSTDIEGHFDQMQDHLTQMKAVFEARKALYETLTEQQKATVNNYLPGPFGHHYGYNG